MLKTRIKLLFFLILNIYFISSFAQTTFIKRYVGSSSLEAANSIIQTLDGNYLITGYDGEQPPFGQSFLFKIDNYGDTIWSRFYLGYHGNYLLENEDSTIILAGDGDSGNWLIKTTSTGDIIWERLDTMLNACNSLIKSENGNYYYVCSDNNHNYCHFICVDSLGNTVFNDSVSKSSATYLDSNSIILSGLINDTLNINKFTLEGSLIWSKNIIDSTYIDFVQSKKCFDNNIIYLLFGPNESFNIIKMDTSANILWQKQITDTFVDDIYVESINPCSDNGFIMTGLLDSNNLIVDNIDLLLIRTDSMGDILWEKTFSRDRTDIGYCAIQTADNGIISAGSTGNIYTDYVEDIFIVKTDDQGNIINNISTLEIDNLQIYPNPTHDLMTIKLKSEMNGSYSLYSVAGELVKNGNINSNKEDISLNNLADGIYFLKININQKSAFIKITKY